MKTIKIIKSIVKSHRGGFKPVFLRLDPTWTPEDLEYMETALETELTLCWCITQESLHTNKDAAQWLSEWLSTTVYARMSGNKAIFVVGLTEFSETEQATFFRELNSGSSQLQNINLPVFFIVNAATLAIAHDAAPSFCGGVTTHRL